MKHQRYHDSTALSNREPYFFDEPWHLPPWPQTDLCLHGPPWPQEGPERQEERRKRVCICAIFAHTLRGEQACEKRKRVSPRLWQWPPWPHSAAVPRLGGPFFGAVALRTPLDFLVLAVGDGLGGQPSTSGSSKENTPPRERSVKLSTLSLVDRYSPVGCDSFTSRGSTVAPAADAASMSAAISVTPAVLSAGCPQVPAMVTIAPSHCREEGWGANTKYTIRAQDEKQLHRVQSPALLVTHARSLARSHGKKRVLSHAPAARGGCSRSAR